MSDVIDNEFGLPFPIEFMIQEPPPFASVQERVGERAMEAGGAAVGKGLHRRAA